VPEAKPALFSFNHPLGACPACKGFGRIISIDPTLAIPDTSKSIEGGVVKPWQTGMGSECQQDMMRKVDRSSQKTNWHHRFIPTLKEWGTT
jgi:excinuclease ABC subunit A